MKYEIIFNNMYLKIYPLAFYITAAVIVSVIVISLILAKKEIKKLGKKNASK